MRSALHILALLTRWWSALAFAVLPAQQDDAMARFGQRFGTALQFAAAGTPADLQAAAAALADCSALIPELPAERRAQAAFFVEVRAAGLELRAGTAESRARAAAMLQQARTVARRDGAYDGSYRALLLVQLWQALPADRLPGALADDDRAFLLDPDLLPVTLARARYLHAPCRILRFLLQVGSAQELAGLRDLHALQRELQRAEAEGGADAGDREWHRAALHELARYYVERRSLERAEVYAARLPPAESRPIRALLALQREDHAQARRLAQELVAEGRSEGLQLLAEALEADGDPVQALQTYDRFLAVAADARNRAAAHNGRGDCLLALGRLDEAEAAYREVLALAAAGGIGLRAEAAETEKDLGRLYERRGDLAAAYRHFAAAAGATEQVRGDLARDPFGGSWLRFHRDQLTAVDGALRVAASAGVPAVQVLALMELFMARSALDAVTAPAATMDAGAVRDLLLRRLRAVDADEVADVQRELEVLRARAERLQPAASPLAAAELADFLRGRLLLVWWTGREQAWLLWGRGADLRVQALGSSAEAQRCLRAAVAAVADPAGDPAPGLAAAQRFFLPADVAVAVAAADRVLCVLDSGLARLPLEALPCQGAPLGVDRAVERAPSVSVAAALAARAAATGRVVVLDSAGMPELARGLSLDPLQFSSREGELVAASHRGAVRLSGAQATFAGLRQAIGATAPAAVHVSAHAVDCADFPSQSLLLLSDGPASMVALAGMPLQGSVLVFSACDAAIGEARGHEGVLGLVAGGLGAGARAVVAPVAEVNQQATSDLMAQMHHRLAQGDDPAAALGWARGVLLAQPNYRHPHYWGTFAAFASAAEPAVATWSVPVSVAVPLGIACIGLLVLLAAGRMRPGR